LTHPRSALLAPAVFGGFDGATSVIGILLALTGHTTQVLPAAVGLAVAGGVGMAAGQWLSADAEAGPAEAVAIGGATAAGTLLPALPYVWLHGMAAIACSAAVLLLIGAVITATRARDRSLARAAAETYGVLLAVCAAVAACTIATGAVG
jgi:VIT1/CCC1 family predicted Fe2+/Mn2+ transporter